MLVEIHHSRRGEWRVLMLTKCLFYFFVTSHLIISLNLLKPFMFPLKIWLYIRKFSTTFPYTCMPFSNQVREKSSSFINLKLVIHNPCYVYLSKPSPNWSFDFFRKGIGGRTSCTRKIRLILQFCTSLDIPSITS